MAKYNWKDNYGFDEASNTTVWLSTVGDKNITQIKKSSRDNPMNSLGITGDEGLREAEVIRFILSSGIHKGSIKGFQQRYFYGQGMGKTIFRKSFLNWYVINAFYNLTVDETLPLSVTQSRAHWENVEFLLPHINYGSNLNNASFKKCKITGQFYNNSMSEISFLKSTIPVGSHTTINVLYDSCNISITSQADVDLSKTRYTAFNNCKFKIGTDETEYTPLTGNTAEELRQSFISRCEAAGYPVPSVTEFNNGGVQGGRWIFSNTSAIDGLVLKDSEIHLFEKYRLLYFGYSSERNPAITISSDTTKASSFSPANVQNVNVKDNSISLLPSVDISKTNTGIVNSNIISFGAKQKLNKLDVLHNLPKEYGVFLDSTPTLSATPTTTIEAAKVYYVRSKNEKEATVTYKGIVYSSSLLKANNVFVGVDGYSSLDASSQDAVIYEVLDQVMHQTIQMRIVNKIPSAKITAGTALSDGYWYLVEHDADQSNTADYATYGGSNYKVGSSFLAKGTASFTKIGNVHLRRCWKDNFNFETDADKEFWRYEQKPQWFDVLPDDLRCLMKNNNGSENEMQTDSSGSYIASGHDLFYNKAIGVNGIKLPTYPVQGAYMQLRLVISTANPM